MQPGTHASNYALENGVQTKLSKSTRSYRYKNSKQTCFTIGRNSYKLIRSKSQDLNAHELKNLQTLCDWEAESEWGAQVINLIKP